MSTRKENQYILDDAGVKTAVIIPIEKWERFNTNYNKLRNKYKVFLSIQKGMKEIEVSKKYKVGLQTLSDFLMEVDKMNYNKSV